MITTPDYGDWVTTHDDALALLTYAVPGATVRVYRPHLRHWAQKNSERSRAYAITVRPHGREAFVVEGAYSLPAPASRIAANARAEVEKEFAR